jgi:hypothetical protein
MARLNLRKVPDELHRALKSQAGFLGITLEERCLSLLSYGAAVQNWDGGKGKTGAVLKTALPEKNRGSSEVPAREVPPRFGSLDNLPPDPERRAGKTPIRVVKGQTLTDTLAGQERRSGGTRPRGLSDKGIDRLVAAANAQHLLGDKASLATARSLADHALGEKSGEVPALDWHGLQPTVTIDIPDRWPWDTNTLVRAAYPEPCGLEVEGAYCLFSDHTETLLIGKGDDRDAAWADAARRIQAAGGPDLKIGVPIPATPWEMFDSKKIAESIKNDNTSPASPTPKVGIGEQIYASSSETSKETSRSISRDPQAGVQHGSQSGGKDAEGKEVARALGTGSGDDQTKIAALKKIPGVTAAAKITARKCPTHAKSLKAFGPTKLKCPDCSYMEAR